MRKVALSLALGFSLHPQMLLADTADERVERYVESVLEEIRPSFPRWATDLQRASRLFGNRIDLHANPTDEPLLRSRRLQGRDTNRRLIRALVFMVPCGFMASSHPDKPLVQIAAYSAGLGAAACDFYWPHFRDTWKYFTAPSRAHLSRVLKATKVARQRFLIAPPETKLTAEEYLALEAEISLRSEAQLALFHQRMDESTPDMKAAYQSYLELWVLGAILTAEQSLSHGLPLDLDSDEYRIFSPIQNELRMLSRELGDTVADCRLAIARAAKGNSAGRGGK